MLDPVQDVHLAEQADTIYLWSTVCASKQPQSLRSRGCEMVTNKGTVNIISFHTHVLSNPSVPSGVFDAHHNQSSPNRRNQRTNTTRSDHCVTNILPTSIDVCVFWTHTYMFSWSASGTAILRIWCDWPGGYLFACSANSEVGFVGAIVSIAISHTATYISTSDTKRGIGCVDPLQSGGALMIVTCCHDSTCFK